MKIEVLYGNIIKQPDAQAIVNSANANLRFGSGVAGAIHGAAGDELEDYCEQYAPLALGEAIITPAFKLPNQFVIHTRAANYVTTDNAEEVLAQAIESMLRVAVENKVKTIAMPAIGLGMFKMPPILGARITAQVLTRDEWKTSCVEWVRICVADQALIPLYESALAAAESR
jgi:O-acetyl-ADP-ribose deacetylase (regulator of RNase III)